MRPPRALLSGNCRSGLLRTPVVPRKSVASPSVPAGRKILRVRVSGGPPLGFLGLVCSRIGLHLFAAATAGKQQEEKRESAQKNSHEILLVS
jgi:hypothetical protein